MTTTIRMMIRKMIKYLPIALLLAGCSAIPPMDNPKFSFGRKCSDDGNWSYVWIYDKNKGLNASKEKCND